MAPTWDVPVPRALLLLATGAVLRAVLFTRAGLGSEQLWLLAWGGLADLGPALLWESLALPGARRGRLVVSALSWGAALFYAAIQICFFEEFHSRPDQIALEYVFYLGEVSGDVWESYPVATVAAGCALAGAGLALLEARARRGSSSWSRALALAASGTILLGLAAARPPPAVGEVAAQVGQNGTAELLSAAWTGHLDEPSHYASPSPERAFGEVRTLLAADASVAGFEGAQLRRRIVPPSGGPRARHVFLVLAESLGAEYVGALGARQDWTPRLDAWMPEGMLFTSVYATGTRTARGLEGVLTSFPPLPGGALPHRPLAHGMPSLASVLRERGWSTTFVYGGDLGFDDMDRFLPRIGFDRLVGEGELRAGLRTSWGLDDRAVLMRGLDELESARRAGRPSLVTVLTVSNHRPFVVPGPDGAPVQGREAAVRFADAALGELLDAAQRSGALEDTLFVLVADHGPRAYLRDRVPLDAHHVPLAMWGPGAAPARYDVLGSSLDVTPTVLGLLGDPYVSPFFGRDLREVTGGGFAALQDKWDLALVRGGRVAVLQLHRKVATAAVDGERVGALAPAPADAPDVLAASSLFRAAYEVYLEQRDGAELR